MEALLIFLTLLFDKKNSVLAFENISQIRFLHLESHYV